MEEKVMYISLFPVSCFRGRSKSQYYTRRLRNHVYTNSRPHHRPNRILPSLRRHPPQQTPQLPRRRLHPRRSHCIGSAGETPAQRAPTPTPTRISRTCRSPLYTPRKRPNRCWRDGTSLSAPAMRRSARRRRRAQSWCTSATSTAVMMTGRWMEGTSRVWKSTRPRWIASRSCWDSLRDGLSRPMWLRTWVMVSAMVRGHTECHWMDAESKLIITVQAQAIRCRSSWAYQRTQK